MRPLFVAINIKDIRCYVNILPLHNLGLGLVLHSGPKAFSIPPLAQSVKPLIQQRSA